MRIIILEERYVKALKNIFVGKINEVNWLEVLFSLVYVSIFDALSIGEIGCPVG